MNQSEALAYLRRVQPALVPVAAPRVGICCETCRSGVGPGYDRCGPCNRGDVPKVMPISMSVGSGQLHHRLRRYKDSPSSDERREHSLVLAVLLALFLQHHQRCLGDAPDFVVTVPSRRRDALRAVVRMIPTLRDKRIGVLNAIGTSEAPRYELASQQVAGRSVLLLDDTFTSGKTITAANWALVSGGARIVGPLVIGRHFYPAYWTSVELWSCLRTHTWRLDSCGICDPVECQTDPPPQALI